jgi:hypothetical protein
VSFGSAFGEDVIGEIEFGYTPTGATAKVPIRVGMSVSKAAPCSMSTQYVAGCLVSLSALPALTVSLGPAAWS